jgi:uncharacterized membrane protein
MASLHPIIVHFTIVLTIVGAAFRLVSLLGRPAFASPAAATLLVLAGLTAWPVARSGLDAHGPVERVPGSRAAVQAHEQWGERTHFAIAALGLIEIAGLLVRRSRHLRKVHVVSAVVGLGCALAVYQTATLGGELVYSYAGGVGIRTGSPADTERLLLAGYYHQALAERQAGQAAGAAALIDDAAKRFPADPEVQALAAESQLIDRKDPQAALDRLAAVAAGGNRFLRLRVAGLAADAHLALGQKDKAIAALERAVAEFPNPRVQQRIDLLKADSK